MGASAARLQRCPGRDRRQPALRGPGRHPRRDARRRREVPEADRAEVHESATGGPPSPPPSRLAGPGDTLLVAGKGHETGQEIAGTVHPFDDRDVLREVLGQRSRRGPA